VLAAGGLLCSRLARRRLTGLLRPAAMFLLCSWRSARGARRMLAEGWNVLLARLRRCGLRRPSRRLRILRLRMRRCRCGRSMLLRALLHWRLDAPLLRLTRWIHRPMLAGLRRLMARGALRGGSPWRPGTLRPGRGFFLAGLIVLRLLRLTRARLRQNFGPGRRALRLPAR